MKTAVIFDIDGTLANVSSIRHHLTEYDKTKRTVIKHFNRFHAESINVPPHDYVVNAAQMAKILGHAVFIVTARKHMWRNHTAWWLAMNNVPSDMLVMRGDDDNRKDYEVKKDMLATIRKAYNIIYAWDDNPSIVKLWAEEGIPTTVVPGWEE